MMTLLFMVGIGAIIGGVTNYLAIKMLFRPLKAYHIGKWRIPFTPGLIPKRHLEISRQLGKVVEQYLITEEVMVRLAKSEAIKEGFIKKLTDAIDRITYSEESIEGLLKQLPEDIQTEIRQKLGTTSLPGSIWQEWLKKWLYEYQETSIGALLKLQDASRYRIAALAGDALIEYGTEILKSEQGKQFIINLIRNALEKKSGMVGFFASFVTLDHRLVDLILPGILETINRPLVKEKMILQIEQLIRRFEERPLSLVLGSAELDKTANRLLELLGVQEKLNRFLAMPIHQWSTPLREEIKKWIPQLAEYLLEKLAEQVPALYRSLNLSEVVSNQVNAFPLDTLEKLILDITAKEFKAITYLGALLGGLIGIVQYFLLRMDIPLW